MGSQDFSVMAEGRTIADAFADAREEAAYEHGHCGYTGTIAEKSEWVLVSDPVPADEAVALVDAMLSLRTDEGGRLRTDPRIADKHGPAGAIPIADGTTVNRWLFFGTAPS